MYTYEQAKEKLAQYGQEHVLKYYDELSAAEKEELLSQIEKTDLSLVRYINGNDELPGFGKISPIEGMPLSEIEPKKAYYKEIGLKAIAQRKVAAVLLAGGMGTRLGSDNPKCMYNIGLTKEVFIMQRLVENLQEVVKEAGTSVPFFIMTSEKNNDATVAFMKEHHYFGYDPEMVFFFVQEMAPAADYSGKVYMEAKNRIATSPNGNGGWFISMQKAGLVDKAKELGVEWFNIFAVDNVLQRIADPVFVGATIDADVACGAKCVRKVTPDEKVGAMCLEDGHPSIIEYYEMTPELMAAKNEKGEEAYSFGVILNYLFRLNDLIKAADTELKLHVVEKKIPYIDEKGELVKPESPNGYKFETLVLDMIRALDSCLPFEVVREKEFAPIKNKTGVDSVESARELCRLNGIEL